MINNLIYFDNNTTTQVDVDVISGMWPYFEQRYGNAGRLLHAFDSEAQAAVEKASVQIAGLINCEPFELIFTSGATEAVNLAIKGIYEANQNKGKHIITCRTEHVAVLESCEYLKGKGAEISYLEVDREGLINLQELDRLIKPDTILVAVMAANNETGVLQPLEQISEICNRHEVIFFSDATQFVGRERCDVAELGLHCMAFSAHKMHGPKGIGALFMKRKHPTVNIVPQIHGGKEQYNKRAGALNVPLIAGFGICCELAASRYWEDSTHISKLRNHFEHQLLDIDELRINGSTKRRLYNTSNLTFPGKMKLELLLTKFAFSNSWTCSGGTHERSHVLEAMKISPTDIENSFTFSFSRNNTMDEVNLLIENILALVKKG
jgi:cysteine desulfurase